MADQDGPQEVVNEQQIPFHRRKRLSELTCELWPRLTLSASLAVWPVEGDRMSVERLNAIIYERLVSAEEIRFPGLPCGTALPASRDRLTRLREGTSAGGEYSSWVQLQLNRC